MIKLNYLMFEYEPKTKTLTAEASELGLRYQPASLEVTGKNETRTFALDRIVKDDENEILFWQYKGSGNMTLKIFND